MKRIAFINQRYGLEVNGGSEYYTRVMAEHLHTLYEVEVLTTKAISADTWENEYKADTEVINGVTVRRFSTPHQRRPARFLPLDKQVMARALPTRLEDQYIEELGPYCPALIDYVKNHMADYDAFIVVTYLYYPAIRSLPLVGRKAIFIPTAHDEAYIYLSLFRQVFAAPHSFIFLTPEERFFVQHMFGVREKPFDVLGVGVDIPEKTDAAAFSASNGLDHYLLYAGRIEAGKECPTLFEYFIRYKKRNPNDLKLVFMGKALIPIPEHPDMLPLGFVTEEDKFSGMEGALALVMPSRHESLSIVILEAMAVGTPVIVNARCEVLRGHCVKSDAGLFYENYEEFEGAINYMLWHEEVYRRMRENARRYIQENYRWTEILQRFSLRIEDTARAGLAKG